MSKIIENKKRQKSRLERLENETGIGKPSWAGQGQGQEWSKRNK